MKRMITIRLFVLVALGVGALTVIGQDLPKEIRGGILNGKAVSLPKPEYPDEARAAGLEGMVFVDVIIDESGAVVSAVAATEPRKGRRPGVDGMTDIPPADVVLREAAEKAALKAEFSPTKL